jgi:hypothetical protein
MFRKAALDRLSSPEELDQLLRVTRPRSWVALLALGGLLVAGLLWGVFAVIPTPVSGQGVRLGGDEADPVLHAVIFVTLEDGRRIEPGQAATIDLAAVRKEEFGFVRGTVRQVAEFPSDQHQMQQLLNSDAYAQALATAGMLIAVQVDLRPDPTTPSGYAWSTGSGPPITMKPHMICAGMITIREQAPISLVIP